MILKEEITQIRKLMMENSDIIIRKITDDDLPIITEKLSYVYDKLSASSESIWGLIGDYDENISVVAVMNNKVCGFYMLRNENIMPNDSSIYKELEGLKGLEGVALGVFKEYKNLGIGKKLIEYPRTLGYDYIWGYQLKKLDNIDDWLKRRKIYYENKHLYITYQIFNEN